ncbi:myosin-9-like [Rhododendron vialii]|uniref:myosin-9-like n=1 Tax=Rhododendron vialii TaxID=182163 RepID=UPI0026601448|nr:myosin-9-like [Rhododendron vialii]XP_058184574.1 myosin-9-like [Rhododendron vialii]
MYCSSFLSYVSVQRSLEESLFCLMKPACFQSQLLKHFHKSFYQTFKSHKGFIKPKLSRTDFAIAHYAGEIGQTKLFLRTGQMAELDARRAEKLNKAAKTIQRKMRTHISRKRFIAIRRATICIQSIWSGRLACKLYETMKREAATVKIQTTSHRHLARMAYIRIKSSVLVLQTGLHAMAARNEFRCRKQTKASIIIQAHWRGHRDFSHHKKLRKASIVTQCRWRGRIAKRGLRKLKMVRRWSCFLAVYQDGVEDFLVVK